MQADISLGKRLTSSIGKKIVVALTGLFLTLFLVVHLMGNLQLLKNDGGEAFNHYSEFMGHNPLIQTISKVNFAFILGHAIWGIFLAFKNRAARPTRYAVNKPGANSRWASRNMALLGCNTIEDIGPQCLLFADKHQLRAPAHRPSLRVIDGKTADS